jgi:hypothetical protein
MPVRVVRPSSEAEMVATFLRGELDSERFGPAIRAEIDERLLLEPNLEDEEENALRRAALEATRAYERREGLFHGFPDDVRWERVALAPDEVLALRYIQYSFWNELSGGSRRPLDAAERIRDGIAVFGRLPTDGFLAAAESFSVAGLPELIVVGGTGPELVLLEGHVRLTLMALRPELLPPELEVLLGRSPRTQEWALW